MKGLREARAGNWRLINAGGATTSITRNYLTLFFDHGSNPDPAITVQQHAPSTRLSVNVAGAAGRTLSIALSTPLPTVSITASTPNASEQGSVPGEFTIPREGPLEFALTLTLQRAGAATAIADFTGAGTTVNFAAGEAVKSIPVHPIADSLAEGPETVVLTIPSGEGYTVGASPSATVTLLDGPFDQWRFENNLPNIIGTDDSDGDGMVDLLEYTLVGDPRVANPSEWPKATIVGQHLTLAFPRNTLAADSTIKVQAATNLAGPWQDLAQSTNGGAFTSLVAPGVIIVEESAGTARNVTVTDSATVGVQTTRFLRVQSVR